MLDRLIIETGLLAVNLKKQSIGAGPVHTKHWDWPACHLVWAAVERGFSLAQILQSAEASRRRKGHPGSLGPVLYDETMPFFGGEQPLYALLVRALRPRCRCL